MAKFDLSGFNQPTWSDWYRPVGEDTFEKESFEEWWQRHSKTLSHLPAKLCEQWVFKHWKNSPYSFIPLESLQCATRVFDTSSLFSEIYEGYAAPLEPEHDYSCFEALPGGGRHSTAVDIDDGSWEYPIIALSTPQGIASHKQVNDEWTLVLIEGHCRFRYLHARWKLGYKTAEFHKVYIISSPLASR